MFARFRKPILATSALLAAPAMLQAEVIELRSGGTLVGDARLEGSDKIVVESRAPSADRRCQVRGLGQGRSGRRRIAAMKAAGPMLP